MKPEGNADVSIASRITAGVFSYQRHPVLATLIGPFIGLIYVLTLPAIVIATVLYYLGRRIRLNYTGEAKRALHSELPGADLTGNPWR